MKLFRPVGTKELELIEQSGFTAFPPRLPEQPIFYPVLNVEYATEIAELWVPAEELDEFNRHIIGKIKVIKEF